MHKKEEIPQMKITYRCQLCTARQKDKCLLGHEIYQKDNPKQITHGWWYTDFDCKDKCVTHDEVDEKWEKA